MKKRVHYNYLDNMLLSELLISATSGGKYRVQIILEPLQVKVKNINQNRIIKKSKILSHITYAKQVAKKYLKELGVEFDLEVRKKA